jgi:hypothetical protein
MIVKCVKWEHIIHQKDSIKTVVSVPGGNIPTKQQLPPAKIVPVVISLLMLVKLLNNMMILMIAKSVRPENNSFQQFLNVPCAKQENINIPTPLQMPLVFHVLAGTF